MMTFREWKEHVATVKASKMQADADKGTEGNQSNIKPKISFKELQQRIKLHKAKSTK